MPPKPKPGGGKDDDEALRSLLDQDTDNDKTYQAGQDKMRWV